MMSGMNDRLKRWLKIDALNRAWRTVLQGVVTAALGAAGDVVLQAVRSSWFEHRPMDWRQTGSIALGAAATAAVMAVLAYLHRTVIDPSSVPSAQPPSLPMGVRQPPATTPSPAVTQVN